MILEYSAYYSFPFYSSFKYDKAKKTTDISPLSIILHEFFYHSMINDKTEKYFVVIILYKCNYTYINIVHTAFIHILHLHSYFTLLFYIFITLLLYIYIIYIRIIRSHTRDRMYKRASKVEKTRWRNYW